MAHSFILISGSDKEAIQYSFVDGVLPKEGDTLNLVCTKVETDEFGIHLEIKLKVKEGG